MSEFIAGESDPSDFTAQEVKDHLATADAAEFTRVVDAEKAGQNRTTVVNYTQSADKVGESPDGYTRVVVGDGSPSEV